MTGGDWADSIDDESYAVDTKIVGDESRSPYVPDSKIPDTIREAIGGQQEDEMARYAAVIGDEANPLVGLQIITPSIKAANYFGGLLEKYLIPGEVLIR